MDDVNSPESNNNQETSISVSTETLKLKIEIESNNPQEIKSLLIKLIDTLQSSPQNAVNRSRSVVPATPRHPPRFEPTLLSEGSGLFNELVTGIEDDEEEDEEEFEEIIEENTPIPQNFVEENDEEFIIHTTEYNNHTSPGTNTSNLLQRFLYLLPKPSRRIVDILMAKGRPVMNNELMNLTGVKDMRGLGGAMKGINNAARKLNIISPVKRNIISPGEVSYEFYFGG